MYDDATDGLMTVGQLSRRMGLSIKAIRQYEAFGLIYSAGRSDGNYRLFDESALWCVQLIETLRSRRPPHRRHAGRARRRGRALLRTADRRRTSRGADTRGRPQLLAAVSSPAADDSAR